MQNEKLKIKNILLCVVVASSSLQAQAPDFSGTWRLDETKSKALLHMINHTAWVLDATKKPLIDPKTGKKITKLYTYDWKTEEIPIVKVTFAKDDLSTIESFEIKGKKWYPNISTYKLGDGGVSGTIDIKGSKVSYDANYFDLEQHGVSSTYHVEGPINNAPLKRPNQPEERDRPPFV